MWTYRGVDVWPAEPNSTGIRWYARTEGFPPILRADSKDGMRELIRRYLGG